MQIAALAVAEHAREFEDLLPRRRRAVSWRRIPARSANNASRACRRRGSIRCAGACRCVSLPGETCRMPVSTSAKPCSSNQARTALVIAPRAIRNGFRSACRAGDHHGDGWSIPAISTRRLTGTAAGRPSIYSGNRQKTLILLHFPTARHFRKPPDPGRQPAFSCRKTRALSIPRDRGCGPLVPEPCGRWRLQCNPGEEDDLAAIPAGFRFSPAASGWCECKNGARHTHAVSVSAKRISISAGNGQAETLASTDKISMLQPETALATAGRTCPDWSEARNSGKQL